MLDISNHNIKLLKMQASILNLINDNNSLEYKKAFDKYSDLAKIIDKENYIEYLDKVKKYQDMVEQLPLSSEIEYLEDLENSYNQFNEVQYRLKENNPELELTNIEDFNIEYIVNRKDIILGYLFNKENLDRYNKELEKLNNALIEENKKKSYLIEKYKLLDDEIINSFIKSEGRIKLDNGDISNTSVLKEYNNYNYDVNKLLKDEDLLKEELNMIYSSEKELMENYNAVLICYNMDKSPSNKEIFDETKKNLTINRHKICLLRILETLKKKSNSYEELIIKINEIKGLINERKYKLNELNIKFMFDPFLDKNFYDKLNINNIEDNTNKIKEVRNRIIEVDEILKDCIDKDTRFYQELLRKEDIYNDKNSLKDIIPEEILKEAREEKNVLNKVVQINDVPDGFKINRSIEKTDNVIKKVSELVDEKISNDNEFNPILEINLVNEVLDNASNEEKLKEKSEDLITDLDSKIQEKENETLKKDTIQEGTPLFNLELPEMEKTINKDEGSINLIADLDKEVQVKELASTENDTIQEGTPLFDLELPEIERIINEEKKTLNLNDDLDVELQEKEYESSEKNTIQEETSLFDLELPEIETIDKQDEKNNDIFLDNIENPFGDIQLFDDRMDNEYEENKLFKEIINKSNEEYEKEIKELDDEKIEDSKQEEQFWEYIPTDTNNENDDIKKKIM